MMDGLKSSQHEHVYGRCNHEYNHYDDSQLVGALIESPKYIFTILCLLLSSFWLCDDCNCGEWANHDEHLNSCKFLTHDQNAN